MGGEKRIIGLDIIRTIAIFSVIFGHISFLFLPLVNLCFVRNIIRIFISYSEIIAFFGVELFFVLSGFLISNILFDILHYSTDINFILKNFLLGRWLRTLPNYFLFFIINYFIYKFFLKIDIKIDVRFALFLQNFITPHPVFYKEAWSLSVEEWFYLLFPIISIWLVIYNKFSLKATFLISISFFIIYSLLAKLVFLQYYNGLRFNFDEYFRKIVIFRFDGIAIGIFGFWIFKYYTSIWYRYKYLSLGVSLVLIPVSFFVFFMIYKNNFLLYNTNENTYILSSMFYTPLWAVLILGVFPFFSSFIGFKTQILNRVFMFLSKISYSLYLCNLPLLIVFKRTIYIPNNSIMYTILNLFVYLFILIIVSYVIYKYYERIFMAFRIRILPYYNMKNKN